MNNKTLDFDTNEYNGESVILGKDLPEDSDYYTLKYVDECINMEELENSISTEGIKDIYTNIKETILKMLEWIYNKITAFINYIKEFFYSLEKTIDSTIKSLDSGMRQGVDIELSIPNIKVFKSLYPYVLYFGDNMLDITDYIIEELPKKVDGILDNCIKQLDNNLNVEYSGLCLIDNILYLNKENISLIEDGNIISTSIRNIDNQIMSRIGKKSEIIVRLESIKKMYSKIDHSDKIKEIRKTYKELEREVRNSSHSEEELKILLNKIKVLGITIPTNIIKTEVFLFKTIVDSYRYISSKSIISPLDMNSLYGGSVGLIVATR